MATIEQIDLESFLIASISMTSRFHIEVSIVSSLMDRVNIESFFGTSLNLESGIYLEEI